MIEVELEDRIVEFPDDTTEEQITTALKGVGLIEPRTKQGETKADLARQMEQARIEGVRGKGIEAVVNAAPYAAQAVVQAASKIDPTGFFNQMMARQGIPQTQLLPERDAQLISQFVQEGMGNLGAPEIIARPVGEFVGENVAAIPEMAPALALGKFQPKPVGRLFQGQMLTATPQAVQQLTEAQSAEEAIKGGLHLGASVGFPALIELGLREKGVPIPDYPGRAIPVQRGALPPRPEPAPPLELLTPEQARIAAERMQREAEGGSVSLPEPAKNPWLMSQEELNAGGFNAGKNERGEIVYIDDRAGNNIEPPPGFMRERAAAKRAGTTQKLTEILKENGVEVDSFLKNPQDHVTSVDKQPDGSWQVRIEHHTDAAVSAEIVNVRRGESLSNPGKFTFVKGQGTIVVAPDGTTYNPMLKQPEPKPPPVESGKAEPAVPVEAVSPRIEAQPAVAAAGERPAISETKPTTEKAQAVEEATPKQVEVAGAVFDVVQRNPDGTLKLRSEGGDFDTLPGEQWKVVGEQAAGGAAKLDTAKVSRAEFQKSEVDRIKAQRAIALLEAENAIRKNWKPSKPLPVGINKVSAFESLGRHSKAERKLLIDLRIARQNAAADLRNDFDIAGRVWDEINRRTKTEKGPDETQRPKEGLPEVMETGQPKAEPTPSIGGGTVPSLFVKDRNQMRQVTPRQASELMGELRRRTGYGASKLPELPVFDANGNRVGYVSYNGNVWLGAEGARMRDLELLYNNSGLVKNARGEWDIPTPKGHDKLVDVQDKLMKIRERSKSYDDAGLAARNPEFAKLIQERDRLLDDMYGKGEAPIDISATAEPTTPPTPAAAQGKQPDLAKPATGAGAREGVALFSELQANTREFNNKRTTKARKQELIERQKELRKELLDNGYTPEQVKGVEMLQAEMPAKPTPAPAKPAVEGKGVRPFEVDEQLVMRSPHTGDDTVVSFRGLMPDGRAVVWTGKTQFPVPAEWLRRQGEAVAEQKPVSVAQQAPTKAELPLAKLSKEELVDLYRKEVPLAGTTLRSALLKKSAKSLRQDIETARSNRRREAQELDLARQVEPEIKAIADNAGGAWRTALNQYAADQGWSFHPPSETTKGEYVAMLALERARKQLKQPTPSPATGEGSVGPGAASPGDVPKAAQIVQLTEELKRIESKPVPFSEKVREWFNLSEHRSLATDAVGRALDGLKTTRDYLIKKWDGVKDWDDIKRVKGELSAEINTRGWSLKQFEKSFRKAVPKRTDREAISSYLDTGGDPAKLRTALSEVPERHKQSYRDALNLSPDLKLAAEHIRSYFEARLQEAMDAGILREGIEDYIHRIYKRDTPQKRNILNRVQSGELNTRTPGLAMQRVFEYDYEAEKAGYPIMKDALARIVDYEYSLARVIADRAAVKKFMEIKMPDGRPMVDVAGIGSPIEGEGGVTEAMLIKPQYKVGDPNEPGKPTYRKDYLERNDYPAFRRWKWVETDPVTKRDTFVQGDVLVHPDAAARVDALLKRSALRQSKVLSGALGVSSMFKQTMLDFSGFHQVQIGVHGLEHRVTPWNLVKDIDVTDPKVQGLLRGGLNIGGDFHAFNYREGLVGRSLSRYIPGLGDLMQTYHEYLFRDYIPRVKTTMALHALERNRQRYPGMAEEQLNYLTAKQANAAFGELNYIVMERSKTAQDLSRLILLAPDFLEARGSFAAQALQRAGMKGDKSKGLAPWDNEQRQALLLGALTLWVTARIANKMIDDQYHFEPENAFSIVHDGHTYSLRTVQGDLLHLWDKPFEFWLNRLNPVFGRTFLELATGRDYFGRKRSRMELAWDLLANIRPIAFRNNEERKLWENALNAFGVQAKRWSDVDKAFKLAQTWKEANGIQERGEFIYDSEKDPLRPLKIALNHGDEAEAAKAIKTLFAAGYNRRKLNEHFRRYADMSFTGTRGNDMKFLKTLSPDEKETVDKAREHKRTIAQLYFKALGQYDAALRSPPTP